MRIEIEQFKLIELNSYQFFPTAVGRVDFKRCVTDCVYIGRELKAKGKTQLLANHLKIFTWGYLRVAHKETHTVNNILVTASQFFKLSKLIGMCNVNFSVGKI